MFVEYRLRHAGVGDFCDRTSLDLPHDDIGEVPIGFEDRFEKVLLFRFARHSQFTVQSNDLDFVDEVGIYLLNDGFDFLSDFTNGLAFRFLNVMDDEFMSAGRRLLNGEL